MMKKTIKYLIAVFFMILVNFQAQAYALKELNVPKEVDESNLEQSGLMVTNKSLQPIVRPNVEYKAQGLRNPFEQSSLISETANADIAAPQVEKLPELTVQGVIWGGSLAQAIINNKVVKVGDVLEGAEIVDINKEGVTVLFAGVDHKLSTLPAMGQQENLKK